MRRSGTVLPHRIQMEEMIRGWLLEDMGRGDRTTQSLLTADSGQTLAEWIAKESGIVAGLPIAAQVFQMLDVQVQFSALVAEGEMCTQGQAIARIEGPMAALLTGERVALNLVMRLSGIASATRQYVEQIADLPTQFVDTRKTTPGLRILEKYASQVGGAVNHRLGLDDAAMIKDNHIAAAGGIQAAIAALRKHLPYPLTIEVETETLAQVTEALEQGADIIMLDNMSLAMMRQAVQQIHEFNSRIKIEASGNITLETIRSVAETGVDYISSSAPMTRSPWLDLSMKLK